MRSEYLFKSSQVKSKIKIINNFSFRTYVIYHQLVHNNIMNTYCNHLHKGLALGKYYKTYV